MSRPIDNHFVVNISTPTNHVFRAYEARGLKDLVSISYIPHQAVL